MGQRPSSPNIRKAARPARLISLLLARPGAGRLGERIRMIESVAKMPRNAVHPGAGSGDLLHHVQSGTRSALYLVAVCTHHALLAQGVPTRGVVDACKKHIHPHERTVFRRRQCSAWMEVECLGALR